MKGSTNIKPFKKFQIRWREKLGIEDDPYLIRWTFVFFGYSIRIHHWLKSDDNRYFHDHSSDLLSIVLKGNYYNVMPYFFSENPDKIVEVPMIQFDDVSMSRESDNRCKFYVEGIFNSWKNFWNMRKSIWFSKATDRHYLEIPKGGAWTLMFEGRPYHKWGFYVNGHKWRPLRYFHKFGIIQNGDYQ